MRAYLTKQIGFSVKQLGRGTLMPFVAILAAACLGGGCSLMPLAPASQVAVAAPPETPVHPAKPSVVRAEKPRAEVGLLAASSSRRPMKVAALVKGPSSLTLSIEYAERIRIPPGSTLEVVVKDAGGKQVFSQKRETTGEAPYRVSIPRKVDYRYPLSVSTNLTSIGGHHLSGDANISQPDSEAPAPIGIRLQSE